MVAIESAAIVVWLMPRTIVLRAIGSWTLRSAAAVCAHRGGRLDRGARTTVRMPWAVIRITGGSRRPACNDRADGADGEEDDHRQQVDEAGMICIEVEHRRDHASDASLWPVQTPSGMPMQQRDEHHDQPVTTACPCCRTRSRARRRAGTTPHQDGDPPARERERDQAAIASTPGQPSCGTGRERRRRRSASGARSDRGRWRRRCAETRRTGWRRGSLARCRRMLSSRARRWRPCRRAPACRCPR